MHLIIRNTVFDCLFLVMSPMVRAESATDGPAQRRADAGAALVGDGLCPAVNASKGER